jgi:hypothetical protein
VQPVLPEKFALIGVARLVGTVENWRMHHIAHMDTCTGEKILPSLSRHSKEGCGQRLKVSDPYPSMCSAI